MESMKKITRQQANCFINISLFWYTIRLGTQNTAPAQSSSFHPITRRHQSQLGTPRCIECFCWRKCNSLIFIIADTERKRKGFVRGWIIVQHLLSTLQSLPQSVSSIDISVCSRALARPCAGCHQVPQTFWFSLRTEFHHGSNHLANQANMWSH